MLLLVEQTLHGELLWDEVFEVSSLQEYVDQMNKNIRAAGVDHDSFAVASQREVIYRDGHGRIVRRFKVCQSNPYRLV